MFARPTPLALEPVICMRDCDCFLIDRRCWWKKRVCCLRGRLLRVNISNPASADTWAEVISEHRSDIMMSVLALQVGPAIPQVVHFAEWRVLLNASGCLAQTWDTDA